MRKKLLSLTVAVCLVFTLFSGVRADQNDGVEEFVTRLYKTFMDREADKDGQEYWLGAMKEGRGRLEIVLGFTRSPEFIAKCEEAQIIPFV